MGEWKTKAVGVYLGCLLVAGLAFTVMPTFSCYLAGFATVVGLARIVAGFVFARALRPGRAPRLSAVAHVTKQMRYSDPDFDPAAFLDRVRLALTRLLEAWREESAEPVGHFVSDALYERLRLIFEEQSASPVRQEPRHVVARRMGIANLASHGRFDVLSVAVDLDGLLETTSRGDGRALDPSPIEASGLCGFWTFLRRRGAKTRQTSGLVEGVCPNCQSPVPLRANARCAACGSVLKGGHHDWVLCAITAGREWKAIPSSRAPGVAAYTRHDPGFSVQHLEDRAAVLFWRLLASERSGLLDPLRSCATEALCDRLQQAARAAPGDVRLLAVEARGVRRGDRLDTAVVEIRWSGRRKPGSRPDTGALRPESGRTLFELTRQASVRSPDGLDLTSAHCTACGAPEDRRGGTSCSFCSSPLNDGSHGWVLAEIHETRSREGRRLLAGLRGRDRARAR